MIRRAVRREFKRRSLRGGAGRHAAPEAASAGRALCIPSGAARYGENVVLRSPFESNRLIATVAQISHLPLSGEPPQFLRGQHPSPGR